MNRRAFIKVGTAAIIGAVVRTGPADCIADVLPSPLRVVYGQCSVNRAWVNWPADPVAALRDLLTQAGHSVDEESFQLLNVQINGEMINDTETTNRI